MSRPDLESINVALVADHIEHLQAILSDIQAVQHIARCVEELRDRADELSVARRPTGPRVPE